MAKKEKKKKSGRIGFIIILILLIGALVIAGGAVAQKFGMTGTDAPGGPMAGGPEAMAGTAVETEEKSFAVNVTPAVVGPIASYFQTNGEVVTETTVDTYADAQGILARLYVNLGDYVYKDQIIAEVDPSRPGLNYALSPVKARVNGTITALNMDIGDYVSGQLPVATIGDLSSLQVVAAIPERYISRIYLGMPAEVTLEAWPGEVFPIRVSEINPVVDAGSRTLEIRLDINSRDDQIRAGMFAKIQLTTDVKDEVVKIPADCVLRRFGETFVYVIVDDRAVKTPVVPGITQGDIVEILEGVSAGDRVVYQGQTLLEDDVAVRVIRDIDVIPAQ